MIEMLREQDQDVEGLHDLIEFNLCAVQYCYEAFDEIGNGLDRETVNERIANLLREVEAIIEVDR